MCHYVGFLQIGSQMSCTSRLGYYTHKSYSKTMLVSHSLNQLLCTFQALHSLQKPWECYIVTSGCTLSDYVTFFRFLKQHRTWNARNNTQGMLFRNHIVHLHTHTQTHTHKHTHTTHTHVHMKYIITETNNANITENTFPE